MDTICAISTAVGESAIGIVRLSGADTEDILQRVFKPRHQEGFEPWRMVYGHVVSEGKVIDEGLAVFFKGPRSYTREDMAEIHCHGGPVALKRVLGAVLRAGCRQAEPGSSPSGPSSAAAWISARQNPSWMSSRPRRTWPSTPLSSSSRGTFPDRGPASRGAFRHGDTPGGQYRLSGRGHH